MPSKYLNKLRGASVVVIGGSAGIGYGVAEAAVEHGASVVIASRTKDKVDAAVSKLQNEYPDHASNIRGTTVDMSVNETNTEEQLVALFDLATDNGKKPIDHVIDTSGDTSLFGKLTLATAEKEIMAKATSVRSMGMVILAKVASRYFRKSYTSSMTLTSGAMMYKPRPGVSAVAAMSGSKEIATKALAIDLAPVRVNLVSPGAIETELLLGVSRFGQGGSKEDVLKMYGNMTLLKRVGQVEDVVEMCKFIPLLTCSGRPGGRP
jgi:NAD(P)-dependent dehydrogenase (short-subunit alcohol dehydrogenase family)